MSNEVYANGRELACKAGSGKAICSFPDVCFTPPQTPATPPGVPIPYPNTGMASDTTDGSKNVKISGKEVMLKNKSSFKKSTGDEAGCAPKKGLINSKNSGKVYFNSWSMDVKFEGENVVRHFDLTTHNHACSPANASIPWPFVDNASAAVKKACKKDQEKAKEKCKDYKPPKGKKDVCKEAGLSGGIIQSDVKAQAKRFEDAKAWADAMAKRAAANECVKARRCRLVPYDSPKDGVNGCCPSQTPDHLIPKASFFVESTKGKKLPGWNGYKPSKAPCMCAEGASNTAGSHGLRHAHHKAYGPAEGTKQSFGKQAELAAKGATTVFKSSGCSKACIKTQLEEGHKGMGDTNKDIKHTPSGSTVPKKSIVGRVMQLLFGKGTGRG